MKRTPHLNQFLRVAGVVKKQVIDFTIEIRLSCLPENSEIFYTPSVYKKKKNLIFAFGTQTEEPKSDNAYAYGVDCAPLTNSRSKRLFCCLGKPVRPVS